VWKPEASGKLLAVVLPGEHSQLFYDANGFFKGIKHKSYSGNNLFFVELHAKRFIFA